MNSKMINLLSDERLERLEHNFNGNQEIKDAKYKIKRMEEKLEEFFSHNKEIKSLYREIDELNNYMTAREIEYFYEAGFRDSIGFLINKNG